MYFSQDYTPHDHRFLEALAGGEHQVHYLRLEDRGPARERRPVPAGIHAIEWWGARRPVRWWEFSRARRELRSVLAQTQPDLVHAGPILGPDLMRPLPVLAPALLTAAAGYRPLVSMSWGSDLLVGARRGAGKWAARYALRRSEVLICDSLVVQDRAAALGMRSEAIVRFPWGVDLEHFSPGNDGGLRQRLGWESAFVVLSTRAWEPLLGVDLLVQGFIQAAERRPDLRLLLLGTGSLAPEINRLLRSAGLLERVHFAGQVDYGQLPRYYRASDLYLSASHSDGSSISLLEAMACGRPALVSDIPGNREWVEPQHNGWWFADGDLSGLAQLLMRINSQREQLAAVGQRARRIAEARANWTENFGRLLQAYERAVM